MGHFSEQYISDCDLRTSDDDYLDRRDGGSSAPSILRNPPLTRDYAERLAAGLARVTRLPAHVVNDAGHLLICDDIDIALWGLDQIVYTVEPEQVYCDTCGNNGDCPDCEPARLDASWSTAPVVAWNETIPDTDIHMASWSTAPVASADDDTRQNQPLGWCYVCGGASWNPVRDGFLCTAHLNDDDGDCPDCEPARLDASWSTAPVGARK